MSIRRVGASDFRGVRERRSGAFSSEIWFGEKRLILDTFDTAEEAARAHDAAAWRLLRPRGGMNFPDVSSQRAQDLAPLPRLFTDQDRRVHRRRQRRLAIAEMDMEAMVVWRERFPQDIVDERQFYKQRRTEREARRTERAAYREDKGARKQAAQLKLKLRETSGWYFEDEQYADAYIHTSEEDITESESESDDE
nr:ethylene-responsive transcription factor 5-like [Aegilops tauschii subsp. strangulata]